jgi:cellobiose dehydrogenase (acceptor)
MVVSAGARRSNHWMGSNKMGTDDGRLGGTAVVDLDLKVYGTDNLFVMDASIFPGMSTGNPSAMIVIASEHAADRILNLDYPDLGDFGDVCGGKAWRGSSVCGAGLTCKYRNADLSTVSRAHVPSMMFLADLFC